MPAKARVTAALQAQSGPPSGPQIPLSDLPRGSDFTFAAIEPKRVAEEVVTEFARDFALHRFQPVVLELDHVATLDVDQVVVMTKVGLEPGEAGLEVMLLHQVQLIQQGER